MQTKNVMIVGVGGQGVGVGGQGSLLASKLLGKLLTQEGFDVKVSEVHGMSQRGGSVVTYVRFGDKVYSPVISKGEADFIVSFEKIEAARYADILKKDGKIIVNSQMIDPMPVITGAAQYPENVLDEAQVRLALFMRERFFCTVYDAVRAMLPAGLWFDEQGRRKASDKTVEIATLALSGDEAEALVEAKRLRSPQQSALLDLLCCFGSLPVHDMLVHTGAKRPSLNALEKSGAVVLSKREVYRRPEIRGTGDLPMPCLNEAQTRAYEGLRSLSFSQSGFSLKILSESIALPSHIRTLPPSRLISEN